MSAFPCTLPLPAAQQSIEASCCPEHQCGIYQLQTQVTLWHLCCIDFVLLSGVISQWLWQPSLKDSETFRSTPLSARSILATLHTKHMMLNTSSTLSRPRRPARLQQQAACWSCASAPDRIPNGRTRRAVRHWQDMLKAQRCVLCHQQTLHSCRRNPPQHP